MSVFTDQTGFALQLDAPPRRIVSLVPSQSELLWDLGLREELLGITRFCIHPAEMFGSKVRVGGTKHLHLEKIRALKPDLIIGNKEENERSQIEALREEFNVWMSDIYTLHDALSMVNSIGNLCGRAGEARALSIQVQASFERIKGLLPPRRVAYFIWNKPYMVAAESTFIDHVLSHLGLVNVFSGLQRYPQVSEEQLKVLAPDLCLLSSEPFPFQDKHARALQGVLPAATVLRVDGEVFSWYGSRLLQLENYVRTQLVPKCR